MWSQPVHDPHKNTRVPAPPKGTQGLGHYFVLDHSLIAKMVEQAKVQYLGCFGYREHLEEPLTLKRKNTHVDTTTHNNTRDPESQKETPG